MPPPFKINTLTSSLIPVVIFIKRMTVAWCMKRAELMFKCIKGFMMEMAGERASSCLRCIKGFMMEMADERASSC